MALNDSFKSFFSFGALNADFSLNCLVRTKDSHFHPSQVLFIMKCIFHKHFVSNPKEFFYWGFTGVIVLLNVLSHLKTFKTLQFYFNTTS